jgi:hypothetical protein
VTKSMRPAFHGTPRGTAGQARMPSEAGLTVCQRSTYPFFAPFEYDFLPPAHRHDRLSDHSALSARLAVDPGKPLITSDSAAANEPPTLF